MGSEVIILPIIFGVIFGIYYLYISARNRERLALIEKGVEASIFYSKKKHVTPIWKVIVLNLAMLSIGIALGVFLAAFLDSLGINTDIPLVPPSIFLMAGIGLLAGFFLTKKLTEE